MNRGASDLRAAFIERRQERRLNKRRSNTSNRFRPETGSTQHPKLIIFYHGSIVGGKKNIDFPFNRLIYYVHKRKNLTSKAFARSPATLISEICSSQRASSITHKIPEEGMLETWEQKMYVEDTDPELFKLHMGVYACMPGHLPHKLFSWDYIKNLMMDRHNHDGILLEDLLNLIVNHINFKPIAEGMKSKGLTLNDIDVNVYSCRSCPGDQHEDEQVVGGKKSRTKTKTKTKTNSRTRTRTRTRTKTRTGTKPSRANTRSRIKGGSLSSNNVTEDEYYDYLTTCDA